MVKRVAFDIDGTLFNVLKPTLAEVNNRHNTDFTEYDITDYNIQTCIPIITKSEFFEILDYIWINEWQDIELYEPDVPKYLKKLRKNGYEILILTRRNLKTIVCVINLLKKFSINVDGIVCLNGNLPKTIMNVDYMIDDSKEIIDSFGDKGYLIKRPYNPIYDVESIEDFVNKIISGEIRKPNILRNISLQ